MHTVQIYQGISAIYIVPPRHQHFSAFILHVGQILEDFQISQSQIVAYKKQLDSCKKELEEERRRGQQLEAEVHVQCIICTRLPGITWYDIQHTNILHQSLETVTLRE